MCTSNKKVLIGKLGLDGHDRGAKLICRYLKEHGYEVVYSGIRQTPEALAHIALQEDVRVIGISILSGAHNTLVPRLLSELQKRELDIPVVVGGIIPPPDAEHLESLGVFKVLRNMHSLHDMEQVFASLCA